MRKFMFAMVAALGLLAVPMLGTANAAAFNTPGDVQGGANG
jgi:hypothetical protein